LKIYTTLILVPYSDSVYKTRKTHFDLLLLKTATRAEKLLSNGNKEKIEGFMSHLYSTLGCYGRGGKRKAAQRKEQRRRREKKDREGWVRENLNIRRPKINYSYVIHPTFESSM
jgi:hypothetical protein